METIIDRLAKLVEMNRKTINGFARLVGLDSGEFSKMMKGNRKITDRTLQKVSDACGVRFEWLLTGEGEMREAAGCVTQQTLAGDNLNGSVKIEGGSDRWFDMMERKDEQLKKKDDQIAKRDDQIDRLLAIIERMQGV